MRTRPRWDIISEAADWGIANRQGLDEAQRRIFIRWLRASPEHVEEYLHVTQITHDLRGALSHVDFSPDALLKRASTEKDQQDTFLEKPILGKSEASRRLRKRGS